MVSSIHDLPVLGFGFLELLKPNSIHPVLRPCCRLLSAVLFKGYQIKRSVVLASKGVHAHPSRPLPIRALDSE